jgi:tellurium resistance protein TerD
MTFQLAKGERADLSKNGVSNFYVGLGWDAAGGAAMDLDVSAFILNSGETLVARDAFVYYRNLTGTNGSVIHTGDNLTGDGDGDDEALIIDLNKLPADADQISVVVSIYDATSKGQNFGQVKNAFIRICELGADGKSPGTELYRVDLEEDYSGYSVLQFGSIYQKNGEWKFVFAGHGYKAELGAVVDQYAQGLPAA